MSKWPPWCTACNRERRLKYANANREKVREQSRNSQKRSRERFIDSNRPLGICRKCGVDEAVQYAPRWCRRCRNEYARMWHVANRDKCIRRMRELRQEHPDRYKGYGRAYDQRHPERRKGQSARCRAKRIGRIREYDYTKYWSNPEKARQYVKEWSQKNPERTTAIRRRTYAKNREKIIERNRRWKMSRFFYARARKWEKRHGYSISPLTLWGLWKRQRGRCALTGRRLDGRVLRGAALDHIVARGNGGRGDADNLRWLCYEANVAKGMLSDAQLFGLCEEMLAHRHKERPMLSDYIDGMQHLAGVMA